MDKTKRLSVFLALALLILSITGCDSRDNASSPTSQPDQQSIQSKSTTLNDFKNLKNDWSEIIKPLLKTIADNNNNQFNSTQNDSKKFPKFIDKFEDFLKDNNSILSLSKNKEANKILIETKEIFKRLGNALSFSKTPEEREENIQDFQKNKLNSSNSSLSGKYDQETHKILVKLIDDKFQTTQAVLENQSPDSSLKEQPPYYDYAFLKVPAGILGGVGIILVTLFIYNKVRINRIPRHRSQKPLDNSKFYATDGANRKPSESSKKQLKSNLSRDQQTKIHQAEIFDYIHQLLQSRGVETHDNSSASLPLEEISLRREDIANIIHEELNNSYEICREDINSLKQTIDQLNQKYDVLEKKIDSSRSQKNNKLLSSCISLREIVELYNSLINGNIQQFEQKLKEKGLNTIYKLEESDEHIESRHSLINQQVSLKKSSKFRYFVIEINSDFYLFPKFITSMSAITELFDIQGASPSMYQEVEMIEPAMVDPSQRNEIWTLHKAGRLSLH